MLRILFVLILILLNAWWDAVGLMTGQMRPSTVSLFVNAFACLFLLAVVNRLSQLVFRPLFSNQTLTHFYIALSVASALFGLDLLQPLLSVVAHPVWFAGEGNDWDLTVLPHLPQQMVVWDKSSLRGFYTGLSSFNTPYVLSGWLGPLTWWGVFLLLLGGALLCATFVLFPLWSRARLSFPIAQIPLRLLSQRENLFYQKVFWSGLGIAGLVNLINGLHFLYPNIPSLGGWLLDLSPYFPNRPLNAIGWTPITILPFGIGLGFIMPVDLLLSSWVFYVVWKVERIVSAMTGWWGLPRFPYLEEQQFGAYIAFAVLSLAPLAETWRWQKSFLAHPFTSAVGLDYAVGKNSTERTRFAHNPWLLGFVFFFLCLLLLMWWQKMTLWLATLFFAGYFLVSIGIGRIRSQLGSPVHDLHFAGPDRILVYIFGSQNLSPRDLSILSLFGGFNRAYRGHPFPHILEGLWLAEELSKEHNSEGLRNSKHTLPWRLTLESTIIGWIFGYIFGAWTLLTASYRFGGRPWYGTEV
ncbi:MAG: hypothetical protein NZ959_01245, partial [Armatimonadetes bacterium]|nr:hypothetical protein [Armatimonadota bacterium]MDW8121861.1 DUF6785 family protein [Armatimonadota bacterium]